MGKVVTFGRCWIWTRKEGVLASGLLWRQEGDSLGRVQYFKHMLCGNNERCSRNIRSLLTSVRKDTLLYLVWSHTLELGTNWRQGLFLLLCCYDRL